MAYLESTSGANLSTSQAVTGTAASTNVFDVTGAGAGNAPAMTGANGVNTALGYDVGNGSGVEQPYVLVTIGTPTTVTGTLAIAIQAAPDNGSYSPDSYVTLSSTQAFTGAPELFLGAQIILPIPPVPPGSFTNNRLPRFYRLNYTVTGSISVLVSASILLDPPSIKQATQYGKNFPDGL